MKTFKLDPGNNSGYYDLQPAEKLIAKHESLSYPYACTFGGAELIIEEGVFCPTLTNASPLLLKAVDFMQNEKVLDVFSGSGAFGIIAAMHGSDVVTVDIAMKAVLCTRANAMLNGVSDSVDARHGTMRECVMPNETFDLMIANPPLLPGEPSNMISAALFDPGLQATVDFINDISTHLTSAGSCYLTVSDVMGRYGYSLEQLCSQNGLVARAATKKNLEYESYTVYKITHL